VCVVQIILSQVVQNIPVVAENGLEVVCPIVKESKLCEGHSLLLFHPIAALLPYWSPVYNNGQHQISRKESYILI
jgi:hypothetical protein